MCFFPDTDRVVVDGRFNILVHLTFRDQFLHLCSQLKTKKTKSRSIDLEPINWLRNTSPADENSSPDEGADITKSDGGQPAGRWTHLLFSFNGVGWNGVVARIGCFGQMKMAKGGQRLVGWNWLVLR